MPLRFEPTHRLIRWRGARRLLRVFGELARHERRRLALGLGGAVGVALVELARPWPLKLLFDHVLLGHPAAGRWPALAAWLGGHPGEAVALACATLLLLVVVRETLAYMEDAVLVTAAHRMVFRLRCRLFAHLQRLSLDFHDASRTGDLLMRLTGDVRLLSEMLAGALPVLAGILLLLAGTGVVMVAMDPLLALCVLALLPLLLLTVERMGKRIRGAVRQQRRREGLLAAAVQESLVGLPIVQAFGREGDQLKQFERGNRKNLQLGLQARRLQVSLQRRTLFIMGLAICAVLAVGSWRVLAGALTPGDLLVFLSYVESLHRPIARLARTAARLSKASACGERILQVLEEEPRVRDLPGAVPAGRLRGAVAFERVTFGYERPTRALRRVTFAVEPGETVALVGASGAGKTTVLNLLLRFYDPRRGRVLIDGRDLRSFTLASLRAQVSAVLQEPLLAGATVGDNIAFGRPDAAAAEIAQAAAEVGIDDWIRSLPAGYETPVGEQGAALSGGQRQLVAIARAVLRRSAILVIDEPTRGLDALTGARVGAALARLRRGRTTFVVAHRFASIRDADRILVLHKGELAGAGPHDALYGECEIYRKLFDLQFGGGAGIDGVRRLRVAEAAAEVAAAAEAGEASAAAAARAAGGDG